jgi:HSP20 family protein
MNRAFESFWNRFDGSFADIGLPSGANSLRSDVVETDDGIEVTVELPGMDQKDVEVTLTGDMLVVKGEKKVERQDKKKGYYLSERSYGAFHRSVALPPGVDTEKVDASFKNGVLTVKLPHSAEAKAKAKRIEVKAA